MTAELATIAAAVIAAMMIIVQLGRQHANELARQEKATRSKLKLEIYQEISSVMTIANDALLDAGGMTRTMPMRASTFSHQKNLGWDIPPITDRALNFSKAHYAATNNMIAVIFQLEKYLIVCPDLDIFRTAFACGMHSLEKSQRALFDFMMLHFPLENPQAPEQPIRNVKALNSNELKDLEDLTASYASATLDLTCYLSDLRTELQLLLLGELFPENKIARRVAPDPNVIVITLEPEEIKNLRRRFDTTEWGKHRIQTMQEAIDRFATQKT